MALVYVPTGFGCKPWRMHFCIWLQRCCADITIVMPTRWCKDHRVVQGSLTLLQDFACHLIGVQGIQPSTACLQPTYCTPGRFIPFGSSSSQHLQTDLMQRACKVQDRRCHEQ